MSRLPLIPPTFAIELPKNCRQILLVANPSRTSSVAQLWMLERNDVDSPYRLVSNPVPVSLGRNGLAWGTGEHRVPPPPNFPKKHEGDGCSPAGVFKIPFAFGSAPAADAAWLRLRYQPCTATVQGVDDVNSTRYNQVVNTQEIVPDWTSKEDMLRSDGLYRWGAFVGHNPQNVPGDGSCIFLHIWRGKGIPTAGCTAMAENDLKRVLAWLDPSKEPRLVQFTDSN